MGTARIKLGKDTEEVRKHIKENIERTEDASFECLLRNSVFSWFLNNVDGTKYLIRLSGTWSVWSLNVCNTSRCRASQTLTVQSEEEETKRCWSGEKSTLSTHDAWLLSVHSNLLVALRRVRELVNSTTLPELTAVFFSERKKQVPLCMATGNVEFMHECSPEH